MTNRILTEEEKIAKYDAERAGTLYVVGAPAAEAKRKPSGSQAPRTGDELPFGCLSDGTPILGTYDAHEPNGRSGMVHARVNGFLLTAQTEPDLFSMGESTDDMTIERVNAVRAVLSTDIPEQLLAAAIAHRNGDALPPTPPTSAIMSRTETGCEYTVNDTLLCVEGGKAHCLTIHGHVIIINHDYLSEFSDLYTLLSDPVVQRLLGIAPTPPAAPASVVRADYLYPDSNDDESYTTEPNGSLAFVDFTCGEARLSVNASGGIDYLALGRASVCQIKDLQSLPDLEAILADPRVQVMRRGEVIELEKRAALTVKLTEQDAVRCLETLLQWVQSEDLPKGLRVKTARKTT